MEASRDKIVNFTDGTTTKKSGEDIKYFKKGFYVIGVSTITAIVAGLVTARVAKRNGMKLLKDIGKEPEPELVLENPTSLALRALAWATFYTVGVFSISIFGLWKWYDVKDLDDLRTRLRKYTRRNIKSEGRTEFESLSDFLQYLNETSSKPKPPGQDT